jgi:dUTPase
MTKLLISLPLSDAAQRFYGSSAPTYNKVNDAGIDLPFVSDVKPYDAEVVETIGLISFETVFAMYDIKVEFVGFAIMQCVQDALKETVKYFVRKEELIPCHFDIRPRSSISKTPFRLPNCTGTIDETYRGIEYQHEDIISFWTGDTLGCYLDYHPQLGIKGRKSYIDAGDRLLQVIAPNLDSILHIKLDFTEENCIFWSEVVGNKNRGGFGSSGT